MLNVRCSTQHPTPSTQPKLKKLFFLLFLLVCNFGFSQKQTKIQIINADYTEADQNEMPDAVLLTGNVQVVHEGATMYCNKAYLFQKENKIRTFGNVHIVQGDTLFLDSKYAEYDGNTRIALAKGNVVMRDPEMTLTTEQIHFDRNTQQSYYNSGGTIVNANNVLASKAGTYYASEKTFRFREQVVVTNPEYVIKTNHLDYNTFTGEADMLNPSTITSENNFIYTEKGKYNTNFISNRMQS